ncbi:hypothetical protein AAFH96_32410, partial [Polymorphospora sp. 2-325]
MSQVRILPGAPTRGPDQQEAGQGFDVYLCSFESPPENARQQIEVVRGNVLGGVPELGCGVLGAGLLIDQGGFSSGDRVGHRVLGFVFGGRDVSEVLTNSTHKNGVGGDTGA